MTNLDTAAAALATARALDTNDARARAFLTDVADFVWAHPEVCFQERESSACHADALRKAGFETTLGLGALDTAFVAEWATPGAPADAPVIAFMPEFDALPALANTTDLKATPEHTNQPGHGCNHSLLGAACSTAAVLLREALTETGIHARLRVVGTPAEEGGAGKVYLLHDGVFDGADVAITWHPMTFTRPWSEGTLAVRHLEVRFHGRPAHAAMNPWDGRSALDAALLFVHGLEMLREHLPDGSRVAFVFKPDGGGGAANVVPPYAAVSVHVRHPDMLVVEAITGQIEHMVRGADRMAWRDWYGDRVQGYRPPELLIHSDCANYWTPPSAVDLMHDVLDALGPVPFDDADQARAKALQAGFDLAPTGLDGGVKSSRGLPTFSASTDVGDVSWNIPTLQLAATTLPLGVSLHTRASTCSAAQPYAHKGAAYAAAAMAACGLRVAADTQLRQALHTEHEQQNLKPRWRNAIPKGAIPSVAPTARQLGPDR